jgi:hypothetical protein
MFEMVETADSFRDTDFALTLDFCRSCKRPQSTAEAGQAHGREKPRLRIGKFLERMTKKKKKKKKILARIVGQIAVGGRM